VVRETLAEPNRISDEENLYWVWVDGDILVMGMGDFAPQTAGEIVYIQLSFKGKKLKLKTVRVPG
jgi:glycine cleavage system H protein